jgi:hypothetical protein
MSQDQRGCLGSGLRWVSVILALGLVLSLPLAMAGRSIGRVLFRPAILTATVRTSLIESGKVEDFIQESLLNRQWLDRLGEGDQELGGYFDYLSAGDKEEIVKTLLPPGWIERQFTQLVRDFYVWLDDDRPSPKLEVDLQLLKANLLGGGLNTFVDIVVDSWPSCKPEQVEALQRGFFEIGELPKDPCEPPEPLRSRIVDLASIAFEDQVRQLPESVNLLESEPNENELMALKEQLRGMRAITLWGWMLPLSILGLIMAFVIRAWGDFGTWWGLPLCLGGVGVLIIAFILSAVRMDLVTQWSSSLGSDPGLQDVAQTVLQDLYGAGLGPLWLQGIIVTVLGTAMYILGRRSRGRAMSQTPQPPRERIVETSIADDDVHEDQDGEPPSGIFG